MRKEIHSTTTVRLTLRRHLVTFGETHIFFVFFVHKKTPQGTLSWLTEAFIKLTKQERKPIIGTKCCCSSHHLNDPSRGGNVYTWPRAYCVPFKNVMKHTFVKEHEAHKHNIKGRPDFNRGSVYITASWVDHKFRALIMCI